MDTKEKEDSSKDLSEITLEEGEEKEKVIEKPTEEDELEQEHVTAPFEEGVDSVEEIEEGQESSYGI